jgi:hypothetical protein
MFKTAVKNPNRILPPSEGCSPHLHPSSFWSRVSQTRPLSCRYWRSEMGRGGERAIRMHRINAFDEVASAPVSPLLLRITCPMDLHCRFRHNHENTL